MRKFVLITGLVLLALLLLGILGDFGLLNRNVMVEGGKLDLSHYRYDDFMPLLLQGEWQFYPMQTVEDLESGEPPVLLSPSGSWSSYVGPDGELMESFGYGVYRLQVTLPGPGCYSLLFGDVYTAYQVYINGNMTAEVGAYSTSAENHAPRFLNTLVPFNITDVQADIIIAVSNYTHNTGGLAVVPVLGLAKSIHRIYSLRSGLPLFFSGIMLIAALLFLFYYSAVNPDRAIIYFALFSISMAIKTLITSTAILSFFPNLPAGLLLKAEYLSVATAFLSFFLYSRYAYPEIAGRLFYRLFVMGSFLYMLVVLFSPPRVFSGVLFAYALFVGIGITLWMLRCVIVWKRSKTVSVLILFASLVLAVSALQSITSYYAGSFKLFTFDFLTLGIAVFIIAHFYEYSKKFLIAYELSRQTSKELEKKVAARTDELQRLNRQLQRMASTDELTTLLNRHELYRRTEEETERYNRSRSSSTTCFSVLFLDLDNFKRFNDLISHEAGDLLLRSFARYLKRICRISDLLFRMGGDEFVIFLPKTPAQGARTVAVSLFAGLADFNASIRKELNELRRSAAGSTEELSLTCSVGIAVHEDGVISIEELIQHADAALLEAKAQGKNRFVFYENRAAAETEG
jgi:diguanylate cyclase (GGDEF)-like protein